MSYQYLPTQSRTTYRSIVDTIAYHRHNTPLVEPSSADDTLPARQYALLPNLLEPSNLEGLHDRAISTLSATHPAMCMCTVPP